MKENDLMISKELLLKIWVLDLLFYRAVNHFDFIGPRFTPVLTANGFSPHEPQRINLISMVNHKVPGIANNWG